MKGHSASNLNLNMRLSAQECVLLPVDCASKDNLQISVHHKPNSRYTFNSNQKYQSDKTWILIFKQHGEKICFFIHTGKRLKFRLPFELHAARNCEIKAIIGSVLYESDVVRIIANEVNSEKLRFKSYFTKQEYQALHNRTLSFIKTLPGKFHTIDYLYRNKSEMYFASVREYHSGIMKPYTKDHNGDPCSVINGHIDGLFFSTAVDFQTMKPLPESLYGPVRLHIDAITLFTPNFNLYFADFFCHYRVHYVTVVLTPKRSPTDQFCERRLLKLDIRHNPFIYLSETKEDFYEVIVYLSNGLRVEVFYTEAVNISRIIENQQGHFERVPIIGRGESRPTGIPKNGLCKICNL
ncbi:phytanoyl-CoA hydroxylase-interacting protein-like isoform X3 [Mytilus trossulus]